LTGKGPHSKKLDALKALRCFIDVPLRFCLIVTKNGKIWLCSYVLKKYICLEIYIKCATRQEKVKSLQMQEFKRFEKFFMWQILRRNGGHELL
jgi:hypothetical protein